MRPKIKKKSNNANVEMLRYKMAGKGGVENTAKVDGQFGM